MQCERQLEQRKEIVNGQPPLSPGVAHRILNYFQTEDIVTDEKANEVRLSERENEVLR